MNLKENDKDLVNSLVLLGTGVGVIMGAVCSLLTTVMLAEANNEDDSDEDEDATEDGDNSQQAEPSSGDADSEENKQS